MSIKEHPPLHVPVLLDDVIALLNPRAGETYLDLTAGMRGRLLGELKIILGRLWSTGMILLIRI